VASAGVGLNVVSVVFVRFLIVRLLYALSVLALQVVRGFGEIVHAAFAVGVRRGVFTGVRAKRFAGQQFDGGFARFRRGRDGGAGRVLLAMSMAVIVIFEIFENVGDVQESVAIEADVNESGLHTGEHAGDAAFVDAADEGEFLFALDVNLD
jgi:hypothetical protein